MTVNVLQVNTTDARGGAAGVMLALHSSLADCGISSEVVVGTKCSKIPQISELGPHRLRTSASRRLHRAARRVERVTASTPAAQKISAGAHWAGDVVQDVGTLRGFEDFEYPETYGLLDRAQQGVDILHCHNLHGGYFDLRALPSLSSRVPTILTLHDAWLLSGHCAHSFECSGWAHGCGKCPDLSIYPAIRRDATARNWRVKRDLFVRSRLHIATPSNWLMKMVEHSSLWGGAVEARVIPNGVDLNIFRPGDKGRARSLLSIPPDAAVVLFVSHGIVENRWKDFPTMREAIARASSLMSDRHVLFIGLGEQDKGAEFRTENMRFVRFVDDPGTVATYYQAADIYLHAARADTFPQVVLEALACGTPVVATAVGGIPEQVRSLYRGGHDCGATHSVSSATGVLTPARDAEACARALVDLLSDPQTRASLSENAVADAANRFGLHRQVSAYADWYRELTQSVATRGLPRR